MVVGSFRARMAVAALVLLGAGRARGQFPASGTRAESFVHGNYTRTYLLHVPPSYDGRAPMPLVLVLHGQNGEGFRLLRRGAWEAKADREGFLVAAPDATGPSPAWNSGYNNGRNYPVDDVAFLRELIDRLGRRFRVDPRRVYACGLSSGAMMSYRIAAEMPERIAAIGPVAGSIGASLGERGGQVVTIPTPRQPVSVLAIHGLADPAVPYAGTRDRVTNFLPVADSIAFWVRVDGCNPRPRRATFEGGRVVVDTYSGSPTGAEVVLVTIVGGGHEWPHPARPGLPGLDATEVLWDFFARHPKPATPSPTTAPVPAPNRAPSQVPISRPEPAPAPNPNPAPPPNPAPTPLPGRRLRRRSPRATVGGRPGPPRRRPPPGPTTARARRRCAWASGSIGWRRSWPGPG